MTLIMTSGLEMGVVHTDAIHIIQVSFILRKQFPLPYDAITILPNNDTCRNKFMSVHCNHFLVIFAGHCPVLSY
jgi:hypothetical protein